jgi:hypothetical protein
MTLISSRNSHSELHMCGRFLTDPMSKSYDHYTEARPMSPMSKPPGEIH